MGLGSLLFGKKKEVKQHPLFPKMPYDIRLNGLVEFLPSSRSYFLLNDSKLDVVIPDVDGKAVISAVSSFRLFDIDIKRVYLNETNPASILQFHIKQGMVRDCILFNLTNEIILDDRDSRLQWDNMIGFKDISTQKFSYNREWMADLLEYGDKVTPLRFDEQYFTDVNDYIPITNRSMLYARIFEDGSPDDIEYLLASIRTGVKNERVEIWVGAVIDINQVKFI